ncbi:MAG TPA: APC family permease, partial [Candidatus Dormibacteraeota bacterium]|nr:APC family permease [Candidatus Dormibacteraeota bacterium]
GGVGTYVPLLMLVGIAAVVCWRDGSATHFTVQNMLPAWNWDTVNFWSQIAFAFSGLELVSAMSQEVRNPQRTLPRGLYAAGVLIAAMYIVGTVAVLVLIPAAEVSTTSGVFQAITAGSIALRIAFLGILAAIVVTVGNAGGVGSTVAGIARVPFVVGIDRYLPAAFGKIHPRWRTPYISILVQAALSCAILLISQVNESTRGAYQFLVDATIILYFIPFLYMFAAAIRLYARKDRGENSEAVLIPGGKAGVWIVSGTGFFIVLGGIFVSLVPPGDSADKLGFELKLVGGTVAAIVIGLVLYWRGARAKARESTAGAG